MERWNRTSDQTTVVTEADVQHLEVACLRAPYNMSAEEWQRYMVGQPYRETFPGLPVPGRDD